MPVDVEKINRERLAAWEKTLNEKNATAMIMLGVGHDTASGELHFLIPEGIEMSKLRNFAYAALTKFIFKSGSN